MVKNLFQKLKSKVRIEKNKGHVNLKNRFRH